MPLGKTGRFSSLFVISAAMVAFAAGTTCACAQEAAATQNPPPYRGSFYIMEGVFVTPVANVPLTAVVEMQSTRTLADGSSETEKSTRNIARDSQGRIYNELRTMVPETSSDAPVLISFHIYDPTTRLNTFLNLQTHLAHQTVFSARAQFPPPYGSNPDANINRPGYQQQDLGTQAMENVVVRGVRKSRTIAASASGTEKPVVVTDEYWYSEELRLNMLVKHDDPRTGQQTVTITQVNRSEPPAATFEIPADYKIVDETPVHQ
jgi:hypothetical protein